MTTPDVETLVVGLGPAGAAAAIPLARAGRSVLAVDRADFPRDKCCGDGLTALALRELEPLGLSPHTVASWLPVADVVIRSPSGREVVYELPGGAGIHAAIARRADLDTALVDVAREAGADVRTGCKLESVTVGADTVSAEIDGIGTVTARHVVAADGMWSPVRRSLGLAVEGYRGEVHALRQYFTRVGPRAAHQLAIWFEPELLPGYAWSFPLPGGGANVGIGIHRGGPVAVGEMRTRWEEIVRRPHVRDFLGADAEAEDPVKAWPIPARIGRAPLTGPGTMFVGDAATATDPMTGEGIGQALLTGRLAAEAILGGADVEVGYEREVRRELVADDRMARALLPLLARPAVARGAIRLTGATAWTRRNFARWMFEDYPRAIVATPRRWGKGALGGAGAYADVYPAA